MSFNFKKKSELLTATFERGEEKLTININQDILTPRLIKEINEDIKAEIQTETGMQIETAAAMIKAKVLSLLIDSWDAKDAKPTYEFFLDLPLALINDLYDFCGEQNQVKKQSATR